MMRVRSKPLQDLFGAHVAALAAGAVLFAACSSTPIDDAEALDATPTAGTSGGNPTPTETAGSAATPPSNAPLYQKQDYPPGPYGLGVLSTIENFTFLGWHQAKAAGYDLEKLEQVSLADYYNPDGRSDVKLLWINASAVWCSVCRAEMSDIKTNAVNATLGPKGLRMLVTLFQDNQTGPARPVDLRNWGLAPTHDIDYALGLDPGFKLGALFTSDATPLNLLVDARTMKVLDTAMGYSTDYFQRVDRLLDKL